MQSARSIPFVSQEVKQVKLAIAASFTAEPIETSLSFWMETLSIPSTIEFAPYNQIFQQLLDPASLLSSNRQGVHLLLLRVEDWYRFNQDDPSVDIAALLQRNAQDLVTALTTAASRSSTPYILCLCPSAPTPHRQPEQIELFQQTEAWIVEQLSGVKGLHLMRNAEVQARYPVEEYYDSQRDRLGHIPFTPDFFAALGTAIARKIYVLKKQPYKVIVLDCDNTLWKGVVGEDGVHGLDLSKTWQTVQSFMLAQQQSGMLLCLCSKNNEADVMQVFEHRQDMTLKREHLVAWRINWLPKSANLKSLAAELNLGLDSFIFIDDNPVECAEVSSNCPEVLTLQLPSEDVQQFLNHVWAFDHLNTTEEDAQRTVLYQQNLERQRFQQESLTLDEFLNGLEMTIEIAEPDAMQIGRVAQLTQRTNQFNCTTIRRTEAEIHQSMQLGMECRAVTVRDRFGDYGLVGAMLFAPQGNAVQVDTFLLSCRVLGRGVEHQMVRHLAKYAEDHMLTHVHLNYSPTQKNQPALNFLEAIAKPYQHSTNSGSCFEIPVQIAAAVTNTLQSAEATTKTTSEATTEPTSVQSQPSSQRSVATTAASPISQSQRQGRIAKELNSPHAVLAAIESQKYADQLDQQRSITYPRTATEHDLKVLWQEVLGISAIDLRDNYFDLGGTSLQAVELFAKIEQFFSKRLPLTALLEAPTIEDLAQRIDANPQELEANSTSSVLALNTGHDTAPRLFLIHPGGGDVLLYRSLARYLQPDVAVYAIKPCTQRGFPILHTHIPEMAAYYIEQIRAVQPEGPYLLGGFCAGGAIALEMALQLQRQGVAVPLVAMMNSVQSQEQRKRKRAHQSLSTLKADARMHLKVWIYRTCLATLKYAPRVLQRMSPLSVCTVAANHYKPQGQFQGELVLFKSEEAAPDSTDRDRLLPDHANGWGHAATHEVKVYESKGNFHGILQEPFVREMVDQLRASIRQVSTPQS
ncbi:HAD-IIIC family phosphatase [Leptolyngbya sp. AN02str]|uniref:HAD-IIIC family phosphatase n=1 Tax=Leptolyngbya sp. AN02str TaxID=3423363 RepID=UPI003D31032F